MVKRSIPSNSVSSSKTKRKKRVVKKKNKPVAPYSNTVRVTLKEIMRDINKNIQLGIGVDN